MSVNKWLFGGAGALCAVGLLLSISGRSFGTDLMLLGVFIALVAVFLLQRTSSNVLATTRRNLTQRLRDLGEAQAKDREVLEELETLQRTTLWYVKNRPGSAGASPKAGAAQPHSARRAGLAGRAATPDVTNAAVDMTFASALDPSRVVRVLGILTDRSRSALPRGTEVIGFLPGRAQEVLDETEKVDLLVVDEGAFAEGPWDRSVGPTGVAVMRDLLSALDSAVGRSIPTVILPEQGVPDIHSHALRRSKAVRLPLPARMREQASGAPIGAALSALDALAAEGRSV